MVGRVVCRPERDTPSPYKVSTITAIASISTLVDLTTFFENVTIGEPMYTKHGVHMGGFLFAGMGSRAGARSRGERPPQKRDRPAPAAPTTRAAPAGKVEAAPAGTVEAPAKPTATVTTAARFFDHQVTVIYRAPSGPWGPEETHNVKVFRSGFVQMTGVKTLECGRFAVDALVHEITRIARSVPALLPIGLDTSPPVAANYRACLINSDFYAGFSLRRDALCTLLSGPRYGVRCMFESYYPAVKVQFMWMPGEVQRRDGVCRCRTPCTGRGFGTEETGCRKVTISVFQSGCSIITGAHTYQQLDDAYEFITRTLVRHRHEIHSVRAGTTSVNSTSTVDP